MNLEYIIDVVKNKKRIYIYGGGEYAEMLYNILTENNIYVYCFVVTSASENEMLCNKKIISISQLEFCDDSAVIVGVKKNYAKSHIEIFNTLQEHNVKNVVFPTEKDLLCLMQYYYKKKEQKKINDFFINSQCYIDISKYTEENHLLLAQNKGGTIYHWRFRTMDLFTEKYNSIRDVFYNDDPLSEYEKQFGKYRWLKNCDKPNDVGLSCKVYMCRCDVDRTNSIPKLPDWIETIQVGAALTNNAIADLKDNEGPNISERNRNYSECTALFWMWKNAPKTDYIGLCHYRRHFDIPDNNINHLVNSNIDVLVTVPSFVPMGIENFFNMLIPKSDYTQMLYSISEKFPMYYKSALEFAKSRFFPPCNLSIMKYDLFCEFCEFAFGVLFDVEQYYNDMGIYRQDRYLGYLMENLLGIFLMHNKDKLTIAYTDMLFYS